MGNQLSQLYRLIYTPWTPWRDTSIIWNSEQYRDKLKNDLIERKPHQSMNTSCYNILLIASTGAGKTSFFNTVQSSFAGRISKPGLTGIGLTSMTLKYRVLPIRLKSQRKLHFNICDTAGLHIDFKYSPEDFKTLVNGKVNSGYTFDRGGLPEADKNTDNKDTKIHCVCFVFSADTFEMLPQANLNTFHAYQQILSENDIHTVVLLTHIDKKDPYINRGEDVQHVFYSKEVYDVVKRASNKFGVPPNQIFPIKNYHDETEPVLDMEILTLYTLTCILNMSEDRMSANMD